MDLTSNKCVPCEGGVIKLKPDEIKEYLPHIYPGWQLIGNKSIKRSFAFVNYKQTMDFVIKIARVADEEGHHPVMTVAFATLDVEIWTHALNGLSENDFILAAKIDQL